MQDSLNSPLTDKNPFCIIRIMLKINELTEELLIWPHRLANTPFLCNSFKTYVYKPLVFLFINIRVHSCACVPVISPLKEQNDKPEVS